MIWLSIVCFIFALTACGFLFVNDRMFVRSEEFGSLQMGELSLPSVSIMIPARDEAAGIEQTVRRILASDGVDLELLILDDHSTDDTADLVKAISHVDRRVRLINGKQLPDGWCGKQFACWQLASEAKHDEFLFLDADIRLEPDAVRRAVKFRIKGFDGVPIPLMSGFPRQITKSMGERLLIPLINYILLCYLPFKAMRGSCRSSASAGCGQFFLTTRDDYFHSGGHDQIRESLHDGVRLPRLYRSKGLTTDVFDASDIASVRMYEGLGATWRGLSKNAVEGVANVRLIAPVSALMLGAHVIPFLLLIGSVSADGQGAVVSISLMTIAFSLFTRWRIATRFGKSGFETLLHPFSIVIFLVIQWKAFFGHLLGQRSAWRGRSYG